MWNTERVIKNIAAVRVQELERTLGEKIVFDDVAPWVAGLHRQVMQDGEVDRGAWSCGLVAGLIDSIPSCQELLDGIMASPNASSGGG